MLRLILLVLGGALLALLFFPLCPDRRRLALKRGWSAALLSAMGIKLESDLDAMVPGALVVANHISWVDILVINAALPCAFVSKEEVRRWPVIGWLAASNDTVFLRRGSRGHARIINEQVAKLLEIGKHVAVFPEGTTTDGRSVLHFHAALIQPALAAGRPVVPLALSYWSPDGERSLAPRYDGDISLGECLRAILRQRCIIARLMATPALGLHGEDRRRVALAAREAIVVAAELRPANNPLETPADLPAGQRSSGLPTSSPSPVPANWG